ncbi:MAG: hypothetical protein ACE5K4_12495 [Candidatus Hydrothermarchaeota archaeon]
MKLEQLPKAYTKEWNKLKDKVAHHFNETFNFVQLDNLKAICENWYDYILNEVTEEEVKDYLTDYENATEEEREEAREELHHQKAEIIWNTLFEAKDSFTAEKIREHIKEINDLGLTVIDISNWLDRHESLAYNTGVFIGVCSAGHDFYEAYWVKLWNIFGWL